MNAYSEDLRQKIVEAVHRGTPKSEIARLLGVSLSSVERYARLAREGKPLLSGPQPHREEAFSKVKLSLRRAGARTREALVEAMGRALDAVTPQDARGFFEHCGYGLRGQSL